MPRSLHNCPAPAKLNLFLHVTGRRSDGYHLLQSAFQLIDRCDMLHIDVRTDGVIRRTTEIANVPHDTDLIVRAARLLQHATGCTLGADIAIDKCLPMGGGLGGGSSDAATTLLVLNHLWQTGLHRAELMQLALPLGADVPFFLFGRNAFAEGIGEQLVEINPPQRWFVIIEPGVSVPTSAIFGAAELTRNSKPVTLLDFSEAPISFGGNDLQAVATSLFPLVADALKWLEQFGQARMSGSGACVFGGFESRERAEAVISAASGSLKRSTPEFFDVALHASLGDNATAN
jgi:4-diphosphocytidyl-2-C-methyl-D-erythritol kinase